MNLAYYFNYINMTMDAMDVSEHAVRYEALHQKLQETLSGIDGL
jgi:hypothetical protein